MDIIKSTYFKFKGEVYIGFCPHIYFHNIMHNDCLIYEYTICDIVFHLYLFTWSKKRCDVIRYPIIRVPSVKAAHSSHSIIY